MRPDVDYYKVLGVDPGASAEEIKKAYRALARAHHPDSTGGDKAKEARFKDISTAYDVLGDKNKRSQYDAMRAGPGFGAGGPGDAGFGVDLGDLFSQMFGGGGGRSGGNVRYTYTSTGPGAGPDFFGGDGRFQGPFAGRARARPPRRKKQSGPSVRRVKAADGSELVQRGADTFSDVRLRIDQAILGAVKEVSTLDGNAKVKIPPGTSSGVKLRLKGKGAAAGGRKGDHFVTVQIDVPRKIDSKTETLLQQLMQHLQKK
jgi:DnaJ-class molecular chaperone